MGGGRCDQRRGYRRAGVVDEAVAVEFSMSGQWLSSPCPMTVRVSRKGLHA